MGPCHRTWGGMWDPEQLIEAPLLINYTNCLEPTNYLRCLATTLLFTLQYVLCFTSNAL